MNSIDTIDFRSLSFFQGLNDLDLARLIPHFELLSLRQDEILFQQGEVGDAMYILVEGRASVSIQSAAAESKAIKILEAGEIIGEMALLFGKNRSTTVVALTDIIVLRITKEVFDALVKKHISISRHLNEILVQRIYQSNLQNNTPHENYTEKELLTTVASNKKINKVEKTATKLFGRDILGWIFCIIIPTLILYFKSELILREDQAYFLSIFMVMVLMWIFNLADDYIPGLFALLAPLAMGLAPPSIVLSGFSSDGFIMAMSFLALGVVLIASGLSYRLLLFLMLYLPNTQFWHNLSLLLIGFFLTPMIPSANGRMALVGPFATDMLDILHFKPGDAAATRLALSAFTGATLMSAVFMNSKSVNFVVFGLLSPQLQDQMHWMNWFLDSLVTGLIMFIIYLVTVSILFANQETPRPSKDAINAQITLLGKLNTREWEAIIAILISFVGIATVSLHKIQPSWVGLTILCVLLLFGTIGKKEFKERIDWSFMIYLAEMVGIVKVFDYLALDKWIANGFMRLGMDYYLEGGFTLFIAVIFFVIFVLRFFLPISATIVLLAAIFMPLADVKGINSWLIGFIILNLGEMWLFPYQCSYYLQLQDQNRAKPLYNEKMFLRFNILMNLSKIIALYVSIPYWKFMGLL